MRGKLTLLFFGFTSITHSFCQSLVDNYFVKTGVARWNLFDTSFTLTNSSPWEKGSIWFYEKLDLREDVHIDAQLFFGNLDNFGADGIAFVMQPLSSNQGSSGGGIGYQGINPSLAIEFDDFYNPGIDPIEDHIAVMQNGSTDHNSSNNLLGPFKLNYNIEDSVWHKFSFHWNSSSQKLRLEFDENKIFESQQDIVKNIFKLDPNVFWGFTSATGDKYNNHKVRFDSFSFKIIGQDSIFSYSNGKIKKDTIKSEEEKDIRIANVFTPNGDNKNDVFRAFIKGHDLFELYIYNRWGEQLYYSKDATEGWNGQVDNSGIIAPSGTYFYLMNYRFSGESEIKHVHGSVQLIRESK